MVLLILKSTVQNNGNDVLLKPGLNNYGLAP